MKGKKQKNKTVKKKVDKESFEIIKELFSSAKKMIKKDKSLSDRYVSIAREIAMSQNIRIPSELKRQICKHCYSYLLPGYNCKVRISKSMIIYHCPYCKKMSKIRIK
jgi:ribonuclease P protein subunit RPR2